MAEFILKTMATFCLIGLIMIVFALVVDITLSIQKGNGWISQDKKGEAFLEIIKEENGCVYYIDVYGSDCKARGSYVINHYNK